MSDDPFSARRRLRRGRLSADVRRGRHLELVTDRWSVELAEPVVLQPRAGREADGLPTPPPREPDRDPAHAAFGPSSSE